MMKSTQEEAQTAQERRTQIAGRVARLEELRTAFVMGTPSGDELMKRNLDLAIRFGLVRKPDRRSRFALSR